MSIFILAEAVAGFISVISNSIVLTAIWQFPRLHTATNMFVGNLALADITVGLTASPIAGLALIGLPRSFYGCLTLSSLTLVVTDVSIFMLMVVALDRFLAIKKPYTYHRTMTVESAIVINIVVWLLGFACGFMPLYGWNTGVREIDRCYFTAVVTREFLVYFQFFGLVLIPMTGMMGMYIYIFIIIRRHTKILKDLHNKFQHLSLTLKERSFKQDVQAAKAFAGLIVVFAIFWLPINIFNCVSLFCKSKCDFPYRFEVIMSAVVMSHANSCINPLIYAASNSEIKRGIKQLFSISSLDERFSVDMSPKRHPTLETTPIPDNIAEEEDPSIESCVDKVDKQTSVLAPVISLGTVLRSKMQVYNDDSQHSFYSLSKVDIGSSHHSQHKINDFTSSTHSETSIK